MSRYSIVLPKRIQKWIREGRGQGHGKSYKPLLTVRNVPSLGYSHRILGWKTGRQHDLLSNLEAQAFYSFEWSPAVTDVREQFPLFPVEETVEIAEQLGLKHPTVPGTHMLSVMSTDFLIDVTLNGIRSEHARTVKPSKALCSERVLQKFEIERRYWHRRGVDWSVITEQEIASDLVKNVQWVHPYRDIFNKLDVLTTDINRAELIMSGCLRQGLSLSAAARACDLQLGLKNGASLALARHFIATRRWLVEMSKLINPQQPLILLN